MQGIICGLGLIKQGSEYYYTDCCGNFISGFNNTGGDLEVSFNYDLARGGVGKLNVPATTSCPSPTPTPTQTVTPTNTTTPTQTPTNTQTPTPSITPSITPSNSPVTRLQNSCDVVTIFDMGISCNVIQNPSSPTSLDGIISVNVTGGTAPYSYFWSGGQRTQTLFGVPQGTYEVIVTDYKWPDGAEDGVSDFTASTICSLVGPTPTQTPTMTPTPTSTQPIQCVDLCMLVTDLKGVILFGPYQFTCGGVKNNKFVWNGSTQGLSNDEPPLVMYWTGNRWEIWLSDYSSPFFIQGSILASTDPSAIPTSAWQFYGGLATGNITFTNGSCPEYPPLSLNLLSNNNSCRGMKTWDGSITANVQGGLAPYFYSINGGVTTQTSPTFTNLPPNTYIVNVYDSLGNQQSGTVEIGFNSSPVTYNLSLVNVGPQIITTVPNDIQSITQNLQLVVTPPLPVGLTINFDLVSTSLQTQNGPGTTSITTDWNVIKNGTQIPSDVSPITNVSTGTRPGCSPNTQIVNTRSYTNNSISITSADGIDITSTTIIDITNGQGSAQVNCTTSGINEISAVISNVGIIGNDCVSAIGSSRQIQTNEFTYIPTTPPSEPWSPADIVCNFQSVNFTSIKGSGEAATTTVYVPEDGTRMYLPMYGTKKINQYSLSVPHNINSTITFIGSGPTLPFYFTGMQMSSDGTKVFVFGNAYEAVIREYTLSVPWDITTMSTSVNASLSYPIPNPSSDVGRTPSFNRDGTKIYASYYLNFGVNSTVNSVVWELSTPYSLSSAGAPTTSNITSSISTITGNMYFENGDDKYFVPVGNGLPQVAVFENGITNNDLYGTSNGCLFQCPDCQDNIHIYDSLRSSSSPFVWTLRQSKTGLL